LIGVRCPVQYLVPAQGAENQVLDEVSTAFQAAKPPGTARLSGASESEHPLQPMVM
jgi:hypothetical protein